MPVRPSQTTEAQTWPLVPEATREATLAQLTCTDAEILLGLTMIRHDTIVGWFEDVLAKEPADVDPVELATLGLVFERPALRDVLLISIVDGKDGGDLALDAQLAWEEGVEYPRELAMRMWGEGDRPSPARIERMIRLLKWLSATLEHSHAGVLALLAWMEWALGKSSVAEVHTKMALAIDPEHGLSEIVQSFITAGHLPAWAFAQEGI
jgi:hypothetical protein